MKKIGSLFVTLVLALCIFSCIAFATDYNNEEDVNKDDSVLRYVACPMGW